MIQATKTLDAHYVDTKGLHCPLPIIHCKATLNKLNVGDTLLLRASDADISSEIELLVKNPEYILLKSWHEKDIYFFRIEKTIVRKKLAQTQSFSFLNLLQSFFPPQRTLGLVNDI